MKPMNIYVASSWRNPWQPAVVQILRAMKHTVYDFRNPASGNEGFAWSAIDPAWKSWTAEQYRTALDSLLAQQGFSLDMSALACADACLLVLPCGNSAHLELGYAVGAQKKTAVLFPYSVPLTEIGGHKFDGPCDPCSSFPGEKRCELPGRLDRHEPELMAKMAGEVLIGINELIRWGAS